MPHDNGEIDPGNECNKMRILHVFKTYFPDNFGGVERTINAIAKGTKTHGIQSSVLSLSRNPTHQPMIIDGHLSYTSKLDFEIASTGFSWSAISKFKALSAEADIVHYHFPWPFMDALHMISPPRKPTIVTYHSDIVKQKWLMHLYRPLMQRFLGDVKCIVATSQNYLDSSAVLQKFKDKTIVIPIGLDKADFSIASHTIKKKWQPNFKRPFFLFIGVLRYYKGIHTLIEAAKYVDFDIVIAGQGPMEKSLKSKVHQLGLQNVHFLGAISDLDKSALLEMCHAVVFPSHLRSEAYGLTLVEAAMYGKPMITCEIGTGTSFVNQHGKTGVVVPPESPMEFARAMRDLAKPEIAELYSSGAHVHYLSELQASKMTERYVATYRSLLSEAAHDHQR